MHFDLIDISLFVNVAESMSLTQGAKRSHISLPAASTRIRNIEDKLGIKLLYRKSRGVVLTPAGETFLHNGRTILLQVKRLQGDLQEYVKAARSHLRIFADTTAITEFLPNVLNRYLFSHPEVNIDLREELSYDIVHAVNEGMIDLGVVVGTVSAAGLTTFPYRQDRLVLLTSRTHPLAVRENISFVDTLAFDYVTLSEGSPIHSFLSQASSHLGQRQKTRIQVGDFEALCRMVETNVGIGILPYAIANRYSKTIAIKLIRLDDEWATRNLQICVRALNMLSPFAKDLIDLLVEDGSSDS